MPMTREEQNAYVRRHRMVRQARGRAKTHRCTHCAGRGITKRAHDWATIHGRDGLKPEDYLPLCKKCHHTYDGYGHHTPHSEETKALLSQKNRGYVHTPEAVEKIRQASLGRPLPPEARAKVSAARKAADPMSAGQRAKISATLKGNTNASGTGRRSGEALENIRLGQQRRRECERAERDAGEVQDGAA